MCTQCSTSAPRTLYAPCSSGQRSKLPFVQLSHFDGLVSWIAARSSEGVLIHCAHGVSRSVYGYSCFYLFSQTRRSTVAAAYLMKIRKIDAAAALAHIKSVYAPAAPNEGFIQQLEIYGEMGAELQPQHKAFKAFRLGRQADALTGSGGTEPVQALHADAESKVPAGMAVYACRACRKRLFLSDAIVAHERGKSTFERKHGQYRTAQEDCTSYFIETYTWMGDLMSLEGKLTCPKCTARVGSYSWAGMQCSCGTWVRPAFQIVKSKVDEVGLVNLPQHR